MDTNENTAATEGCVLYVMQANLGVHDNPTLIAAQQDALAKKLPLGVVYCLDQQVDSNKQYVPLLDNFVQTEQQLADLQIPLLILIGPRQKTLSAVLYHTKPVGVYYDIDRRMTSDAKLQVHPYTWPGTVQTIAVLKEYVLHTKQIC